MMQRRHFLMGAATAALARNAFGANDAANLTVIGLGGRGVDHINFLARVPGANIAAVCDVNQAAAERAVALVEKNSGRKPKAYSDMRRVFEDKNIDAVTMATPNHWHALGTVWACQAGKDVYVEKPACHNVYEGGKMVEAARRYNRMVQVGSQSRSIAFRKQAVELLKTGIIGDVYMAKGTCFKRRKSIGKAPVEPVPAGIDWDQFLGPAPMRPFTMNRFKYNWHWFWDTGNGDIGNQGVHELDFARWALGKALPQAVASTGGKYAYEDDQETPNTQLSTFDYGKQQLVFDVRGLPTPPEENVMIGDLIYGTEGFMAVDYAGFRVYKGEDKQKVKEVIVESKDAYDTAPHFDNFVKAVKSRRREDLNAEVAEGVASADLAHLANISYRVGRRLPFDGKSFGNDKEANALLTREYRKPYTL